MWLSHWPSSHRAQQQSFNPVVFHCCCLLKKPEMYCYSIIVDEDIVTWLERWDGGRWRAKSVDIGMACALKPNTTLICFLYIFAFWLFLQVELYAVASIISIFKTSSDWFVNYVSLTEILLFTGQKLSFTLEVFLRYAWHGRYLGLSENVWQISRSSAVGWHRTLPCVSRAAQICRHAHLVLLHCCAKYKYKYKYKCKYWYKYKDKCKYKWKCKFQYTDMQTWPLGSSPECTAF